MNEVKRHIGTEWEKIEPNNDSQAVQKKIQNRAMPIIIQGGMGVNVSSPQLANAVSKASQPGRETLGTISGTAVERVMARMLQEGWKEAQNIIEALQDFPFPEIAEKIIKKYHNNPRIGMPVFTVNPSRDLIELTVCANYSFVKMAKKWHKNAVSINYLAKIAMPHLPSLYGAILADVDVVTMGAWIPLEIPAVFESFSNGETASYRVPVIGGDDYVMTFDPKKYFWNTLPTVKKPNFIPIISTDLLGRILKSKLREGSIYGFSIETPTAWGHNAPPRNKITHEYGEKDIVNFKIMQDLGLPYWLAWSYASPEGLEKALTLWARGIQTGSIFALSVESGLRPDLRNKVLEMANKESLVVTTDFRASPTGFPFKVVEMDGTMSEKIMYETRKRVCDECALRSPYKKDDDTIGYRCASEPTEDYVRKWGKIEDTIWRKCLCNGLMSAAWVKNDEPPIITLWDDTSFVKKLLHNSEQSYSAQDAINYLFSRLSINEPE